jgi:hypothetical protein
LPFSKIARPGLFRRPPPRRRLNGENRQLSVFHPRQTNQAEHHGNRRLACPKPKNHFVTDKDIDAHRSEIVVFCESTKVAISQYNDGFDVSVWLSDPLSFDVKMETLHEVVTTEVNMLVNAHFEYYWSLHNLRSKMWLVVEDLKQKAMNE